MQKTAQELSDLIVDTNRKIERTRMSISLGHVSPGELCSLRADLREYENELKNLQIELETLDNQIDKDFNDGCAAAASN